MKSNFVSNLINRFNLKNTKNHNLESIELISNKFDIYLMILLIIGSLLAIFYFYYISIPENRVYGTHYFEFYHESSVMSKYISEGDYKSFFNYQLNRPDQIIQYRGLLFFTLFGISEFVFFYSNFFLNFFFLILLFFTLTKIINKKMAFLFTLFIISSYFFLYMVASYYVDLTYFLVCGLFFIYLYLFEKDYQKGKFMLAVMTFLMFTTKDNSYSLFVFVIPATIIYFIFTKSGDEKIKYSLRLVQEVIFGILIFFIIILKLNFNKLSNLVFQATTNNIPGSTIGSFNFASIPHMVSETLLELPIDKLFFIHKFRNPLIVILIYISIIYFAIKKKDKFFIFLFFVSEIYLFVFFNIYDHQRRHFLPFYFLYLFFIFIFLTDLLSSLSKRHMYKLALFSISVLFFIQFYDVVIPKSIDYGLSPGLEYYTLTKIPFDSKVYLQNSCFIQNEFFIKEFKYRFTLVDNIDNADYTICTNITKNNAAFVLLEGNTWDYFEIYRRINSIN